MNKKVVLKDCNCRNCEFFCDGECLWWCSHCIATKRFKRLRKHERFFCKRFIKKSGQLDLFED